MNVEDENQDAPFETAGADRIQVMTDRMAAVLEAMPPAVFHELRATNGLTTDPRYVERRRAIRRLARRLAEACG